MRQARGRRAPGRAGGRLAVTLALALAASGCARSDLPRARNVVLISLDTLRADHLGVYGHHRDTSPHIDALASESFVFERALASSPNTTPSQMSMMTSLYPNRHGYTGQGGQLTADQPTLASLLREAGFHTAGFVDGGYMRAEFGFDRGFEVYDDRTGGIARILERAIAWLEEADREPFFLFLHCYDIHSPYRPPAPFRGMFHDVRHEGDLEPPAVDMSKVFTGGRDLSDEELRHVVAPDRGRGRESDHQSHLL